MRGGNGGAGDHPVTITIRYNSGPRIMRGPYTVHLDEQTASMLESLLQSRGGSFSEFIPRLFREAYYAMWREKRPLRHLFNRWYPWPADVGVSEAKVVEEGVRVDMVNGRKDWFPDKIDDDREVPHGSDVA